MAQTSIASLSHQFCVSFYPSRPLSDIPIPCPTLSRQMAGIQNTSFPPTSCVAQRKMPKLLPLPSAPSNASKPYAPSSSLRSRAPSIIQTMNDRMLKGVDIQLKIIQTPNSPHRRQPFTANYSQTYVRSFCAPSLTDELALLPCFRLHGPRMAVASSTAAATLRQFGHVCHR